MLIYTFPNSFFEQNIWMMSWFFFLTYRAKKAPQVVHFTEAFGENIDGTPLTSGFDYPSNFYILTIFFDTKKLSFQLSLLPLIFWIFPKIFLKYRKKIKASVPKRGVRVYCAGPMFSVGDKHEMQLLAESLESSGYDTYLPQRDGLEMGELLTDLPVLQTLKKVKMIEMEYFTYWVQMAIFCLDIYCLYVDTDVVVMNLNGRVPDEGACCEVAMAFTAGKPIIQYKQDFRSLMMDRDNPMVAGLSIGPVGGFDYCHNMDELPDRIEKTREYYKKINKDYDYMKEGKFPPALKIYLDFGQKIKEQRTRLVKKLQELAPSCLGKTREEQCQIRMVAYMDFFTMLVTNSMYLGVPVPERFSSINMLDLIKLALSK